MTALSIALVGRGSAANDGTGDSARDGALKLNKNTRLLEALAKGAVISATTTAQPASPTVGDFYIIPSGKTGTDWSTMTTGALALYAENDGANAWFEITPSEGWRVWVSDTNGAVIYNGGWVDLLVAIGGAKNFVITAYGASTASSDNRAAINLAIAACNTAGGGTIYVPEGNFYIDLPDATGLTTLGAGTSLKGAGRYKATLTINCATSTYLNVLGAVSSLIVEDLTIQFNCVDTQVAALLIPGSNIRFSRCRLLSNCTAVADAATNTSILLNFPTSGTQTDISFDDCEISGWGFPILKTNASTSTQRRLRFTNSYWRDNAGSHINLNSPNGVMDDVVISGNTFGDEIGFGAGLGFMVAFASITNFKIIGNTFKGSSNAEAIHIEEACADFTIIGNTIEITSDETGEGDGIHISNNNIAGSQSSPQRFTISGNTIRRTGSTDGYGIHLVDTSGSTPISNGVIAGNRISGFTDNYNISTTIPSSLFIDGKSLRAEGVGLLFGNTLSNNGSDATNDIDVAAGTCADSTNAVSMAGTALTKRLDANWAVGTNQGMLDTGSVADGTYHIFRIMRIDTGIVDILASSSPTAPTMPANYTHKRRIGSIIRTSGAILGFVQDGDDFKIKDGPILDINAVDPGTSAVTAALTVPAGIRVKADARFKVIDTTPTAVTHLHPTDLSQTDAAASGTNTVFTTSASVALSPSSPVSVPIWTNASRQIRYRINQSDADISVFGWTFGWHDKRGRLE